MQLYSDSCGSPTCYASTVEPVSLRLVRLQYTSTAFRGVLGAVRADADSVWQLHGLTWGGWRTGGQAHRLVVGQLSAAGSRW